MRAGFKFQLGAWWLGAHYSSYNRRVCINFLPCLTVWIAFPGGKTPEECKQDHLVIKALRAQSTEQA
jgi:hypothetical protein